VATDEWIAGSVFPAICLGQAAYRRVLGFYSPFLGLLTVTGRTAPGSVVCRVKVVAFNVILLAALSKFMHIALAGCAILAR